jgi:hypothetical protein
MLRWAYPELDHYAEELAKVWTDAVWSAIADEHGGFASAEDDDWCYDQCLINGRKSECEPEYAAIFENMGSSPSLKQPKRKRLLQ